MAESNFETGKLTAVYNQVGKRANGEPRYRRANFDVLQWASNGGESATYVVPLGFERVTAADINEVVPETDAHNIGREFGYYGLEHYVVEAHVGDGSDNIFGVQGFGYL